MTEAEQIASLDALDEAMSFFDDLHYDSGQVTSTIKKILR